MFVRGKRPTIPERAPSLEFDTPVTGCIEEGVGITSSKNLGKHCVENPDLRWGIFSVAVLGERREYVPPRMLECRADLTHR